MEESFILNYADSIDATLNKINQLKENCEIDTWSEYERKLDTRLYL
jgi:3'-5' exoribonuclease